MPHRTPVVTRDPATVPPPGWKHTTNPMAFRHGDVFGWTEGGQLWSGIVEEVDHLHLRVRVRDVLPGVMA